LPSDATLRSELVAVRKFNPDSVDAMIRAFKETLDFANLPDEKVIESEYKETGGEQPPAIKIGDFVQWESGGQIQFEAKRVRALSTDGLWAFVDGSDTGLPIEELTIVSVDSIEKPVGLHIGFVAPKPPGNEKPAHLSAAPKMRSYSWALSGDFNARMDLFGEAQTEEDIEALADYVEITIKALKRSLKASQDAAS